MKITLIIFTILAIFLVGCQILPPDKNDTFAYRTHFDPDIKIKPLTLDSEDELKNLIQSANTGYLEFNRIQSLSANILGAPEFADNAIAKDFSETNIQVQGVDEADIIKTDGQYIYTITGNSLFIINAYPGKDAEILSTTKLDKGNPSGLFINKDQLVIFGNINNYKLLDEIPRPRSGMVFFEIYDVSDRDNPNLIKDFLLEGNYFQSRMIENNIYLIIKSQPQLEPRPLPIIIEDNIQRTIPIENINILPIPYDNPQYVTVHSLNINSFDLDSETFTVEHGQNVYMSQDNLYLTFTKRINEWEIQKEITIKLIEPKLSSINKNLIERIKETDNDILSQNEKENKIFNIINTYIQFLPVKEQETLQEEINQIVKQELEKYVHREFTIINKIEIEDNKINLVSNGKVPGQILNQFSMDENKNIFRIATTISPQWSRFSKERTSSTNNIFTLDKNLNMLDSLEGLAENERIFSTRFIDDKLYMVTFRQVDPFFVIDLSDPNNIKNLGELKIPGFSRYLHPYDKDTIIGIGRDATETGRQQGIKVSLFDVSNPEEPKEIAKYVDTNRYTKSGAEWEHKAFLFSKNKNILVIPVFSFDYQNEEGYNGALVFDITKKSIEARGLIDHSQNLQSWYQPQVERSLYIENELFTKSPNLLRINNLEDLESIKDIILKAESKVQIPIF